MVVGRLRSECSITNTRRPWRSSVRFLHPGLGGAAVARIGMLCIGRSGARAAAAVAPRSALLAAVAPRRLSSAALQAHHSFYIDGKWVPPVQGVVPHQVINPATEQPIATIALGSPADVDAAVSAAQRALPAWSGTSKEERLALLERLATIYEARQGEVAQAISSEMGAPIRLATRAQAAAGLGHLRQFVRVLRGFEFEQPLRSDRPAELLLELEAAQHAHKLPQVA